MSEWRFETKGDLLWLFADDHVINFRQVRRFQLYRNKEAGNNIQIVYIDGATETFYGESADAIWRALTKAARGSSHE